MKREFYISKEGKTDDKVAIMSKEGDLFNRTAKIQKYLSLGYHVYELDGTEIFEVR